MNSATIDEACQKLEDMLVKLSPEEMKEEMENCLWEIEQAGIIDPIRTDDPVAFAMDLAQALKNTDRSQNVYLMDETIQGAETALDLVVCMLP